MRCHMVHSLDEYNLRFVGNDTGEILAKTFEQAWQKLSSG